MVIRPIGANPNSHGSSARLSNKELHPMFLPLRTWKETVASFLRTRHEPASASRASAGGTSLETLEDRRMMACSHLGPDAAPAARASAAAARGTLRRTSGGTARSDVAWTSGDTAIFRHQRRQCIGFFRNPGRAEFEFNREWLFAVGRQPVDQRHLLPVSGFRRRSTRRCAASLTDQRAAR